MSQNICLSPQNFWFLQTVLSQSIKEKVLCWIDEEHSFAKIIELLETHFQSQKTIKEKLEIFSQDNDKKNLQILSRYDIEHLRNQTLSLHAPLALEYRGNPFLLSKKVVGIVGSRHPTYYGRLQAQKFALELTSLRFTVLSGGAIGIDSIANTQALTHNSGGSVCVIGNGINIPHPLSNHKLFKKLSNMTTGLLLSEFDSFEKVKKWNFPKRNTTIAELCDFLLVIEATQTSGSLMTAKFAMKLGKPVGALPGSIDNPNTAGSHMLIQNGGYCIHTPSDVAKFIYAS